MTIYKNVVTVSHTVSTASTDEVVYNVPGNMIAQIVEIEVKNDAGVDATIVFKDQYTKEGDSTPTQKELVALKVATGTVSIFKDLVAKKVLNQLIVNSDQANVTVYVTLELL